MGQKPASRKSRIIPCTIILFCLASISNPADAVVHKSNAVICNDRQQPDNNLFIQDSVELEGQRDNIRTKNHAQKNQHRVKSSTKLNRKQNEQPLIQNSPPIRTIKQFTAEEYNEAYKWSQQNQFKVYPSKLQSLIIPSDEIDVTLVTQLSLDRMPAFEMLCERWTGPISAAIYVPETSMDQVTKYIEESRIFSTRQNICCQIVKAEGEFYPINYLRNVALQNSRTNYNFLNDVDFIPSKNLYENIRRKISKYLVHSTEEENKNKVCLVIPAFKMKEKRNQQKMKFPGTKKELLVEYNAGRIAKFGVFGHLATNYKKWISATKPYFVNWSAAYEPYIVIDKNAPKYDTSFVGYGWNKNAHLMEVAASGYKFLVMHDSFVVHMPHPISKDKMQVENDRSGIAKIMSEFLTNFVDKYGNTFSTKNMVKQLLRHKMGENII